MFKFNFHDPDETDGSAVSDGTRQEGNNASTGPSQWLTANEIFPSSELIERYKSVCTFPCGKYHLKHIPFDEAMKDLSEITTGEFIAEAELLHSDLLPGKYEGGLKIWECTRDLADFMIREGIDLTGKHVLDLGCGTGLLGILAMHLGAESVHFQDYNASVIRAATIPNVMLNTSQLRQDGTMPSARFFSGDWKDFADLFSTELLANNKYDCILTSETIYNPDSHQKLLSVFNACLGTCGVMYPLKLYL
ncbi:hypothetical protein B7P43_G14222 [Cryptotermes secundus]|uniref:protein-histidine N-methyltransferase n=1 Tax=Cryptotermes secundus TaxID=105785 RepID=A0A2J7PBL4_9NEOP|nr:hypothetical protein B7P43_G14222 [Cryptotermes secundus]